MRPLRTLLRSELTEADPLVLAFLFAWARLDRDPRARQAGLLPLNDDVRSGDEHAWLDVGHHMRERAASMALDEALQALKRVVPERFNRIRRTFLRHMTALAEPTDMDRLSPLVQEILSLTSRRWETLIDMQLVELIAATIDPGKNEVVECVFDTSALVALRLATHCSARLVIESPELAHVCALLAIGLDADLEVRLDSALGRDLFQADGKRADHLIVIPPERTRLWERRRDHDGLLAPAFSPAAPGWQMMIVDDGILAKGRADLIKRNLLAVVSLPRGVVGAPSNTQHTLLVSRGSASTDQVLFVDGRRFAEQSEGGERRIKAAALERLPLIAQLLHKPKTTPFSVLEFRSDVERSGTLIVDRHLLTDEVRRLKTLEKQGKTVALDELAEIIKTQSVLSRQVTEDVVEVREVSIADLRSGLVHRPERQIALAQETWQKAQRYALRPNDILVSVKSRIGLVGIVPQSAKDEIWIPNQSFVIVRVRRLSPLSADVLAAYLGSPLGQQGLLTLQTGTTVPMLSMGDLRQLPIPQFEPTLQVQLEQNLMEITGIRAQIVAMERELDAREKAVWEMLSEANRSD